MDTDRTYTLQDLHELDFPGTPLAVLGYPVKHSVSPAMHNAAIAVLQEQASRFRDWQYYRFEIEPERLAEALPLFHRKNFLGLNLTVPHKIIAMDLVQGVSADGQRIGAVNTLVWDELGYDGFNTDGYGIKTGLQVDLAVELPGAHVMLLGSGVLLEPPPCNVSLTIATRFISAIAALNVYKTYSRLWEKSQVERVLCPLRLAMCRLTYRNKGWSSMRPHLG